MDLTGQPGSSGRRKIDYVFVEHGGETLILATQLFDKVLGEGPHTIVRQVKGEDLMGLRYQRLFDELPAEGDICRVLTADFVSTDDGTGIVHTAPAYGVDDLALGQAQGFTVVHGIGLDGCFKDEVTPVQGQFFKERTPPSSRYCASVACSFDPRLTAIIILSAGAPVTH
ncbi:MAG: hypothetical protein CM1200mP41_16870 [Gammaproteobacteria bacterium]|nr:MAG: hypothetical protein CM1200mP41_16870 [Gammaproteobacteria bacterium]